jgi:uncharacterized membrane protein
LATADQDKEKIMTIGPLQIALVLLDDRSRIKLISQALMAVRRKGIIRVVDMLYIIRDQDGNLQSKQTSDLTDVEKADYGVVLRGLLEMRATRETDASVNALANSFALTGNDFGLTPADVQRIAEQVPMGGSALLVLFEHTWAIELKEAIITAGGEVVAQGLLAPSALVLGGTTLEEAVAAAQNIEALADEYAAARIAEAEKILAEAQTQAISLNDESQQILDRAEAEAISRIEQARIVAAANIAASVRMASGELEEADKQLEMSKEEARAITQAGIDMAEQIIGDGDATAASAITAGMQMKEDEIATGKQAAAEIKAAAVMEAMKLLVQAKLIREGATQEALGMLASAALIEQSAIDDAERTLLSA